MLFHPALQPTRHFRSALEEDDESDKSIIYMHHLEFVSSHQSFIDSLLLAQCLARSMPDSRSIRWSFCPQSWTTESGQSSVTEWGSKQVRLFREVESKGSAINQLRIIEAEVMSSPDRRSSHLISSCTNALMNTYCAAQLVHLSLPLSWQTVISPSKCILGEPK